jgi:tRNA-specific 2-thiouridylase
MRDKIPGDFFTDGEILDLRGKSIGTHRGAVTFTIGQRRGTRFSSGNKLYVVAKNVEKNTITLGEKKDLLSSQLRIERPVFWRRLRQGEHLQVKIRYKSERHDCRIEEVADSHIVARFKIPARSVTPGQVGVFYDDDIIVAAGFIR